MVNLRELSERPDDYCVGFSQLEAGVAMTRTLLERGYRHVAFAAAQLDPRTLQRADGYRQAMRQAGRSAPTLELLTPQLSSIRLGAELLDRLLAHDSRIDAVLLNNDDPGPGAPYRSHPLGLDEPGQLGR